MRSVIIILIILEIVAFILYLNVEDEKQKYEYILTLTTKDDVKREFKVFIDCKHKSSEVLNFYINKKLNGIEITEDDKWILIPLSEIKSYEVKEIIKE